MLSGAIMVILFSPSCAAGALQTIRHAVANAARPHRLRFVLPSYTTGDLSSAARISYFPYEEGLPACGKIPGNETFFLLLMGDWRFDSGWDNQLISQMSDKKSLLSATPWFDPSTGEKESCLPALKMPFDEYGIPIGRGLALVSPVKKQTGLIADPALLFGTLDFLRIAAPDITTISYNAFLAGYSIQWLSDAPVALCSQLPPRRLCRPVPEVLPGSALSRFEQTCGIRWDQKTISPKGTFGLKETEKDYGQASSPFLALSNSISEFFRASPPYLVTAFVDLPNPRSPFASYLISFEWLKRLPYYSLLVFTGGEAEEAVRAMYPNNASFPSRDLPRPKGMTIAQHFKRSKPFMLLRASQRHPDIKTFAWVDMDILPHPIPIHLRPDFSPFNDGKIHLATVFGEPDLSFFVVPAIELVPLCKEVTALSELDRDLRASFREEDLWRHLIKRHPDRFCLHPMPARQLLFLSAYPHCGLSKQITCLLNRTLPKSEEIP